MKNTKIQKIIICTTIALVAAASSYLIITSIKQPKKTIETPPSIQVKEIVKSKPVSLKKRQYPNTINGTIITLKKLTVDCAFDYYTMFDDDSRKYLEFPEQITYGYVEYYVRKQAEKIKKDIMIAYNIWDNADNKMVGSIQIRDLNDYDPGQLGMWINKNYRGGGRIQEALYLISKAYFDANPQEKSYIAHVRPWNPRSEQSMIKFGFKKTGDYIEDGEVTRLILELNRKVIEN